MMLYGGIFGCLSSILSISAFLSYKSPFIYPKDEVRFYMVTEFFDVLLTFVFNCQRKQEVHKINIGLSIFFRGRMLNELNWLFCLMRERVWVIHVAMTSNQTTWLWWLHTRNGKKICIRLDILYSTLMYLLSHGKSPNLTSASEYIEEDKVYNKIVFYFLLGSNVSISTWNALLKFFLFILKNNPNLYG